MLIVIPLLNTNMQIICMCALKGLIMSKYSGLPHIVTSVHPRVC